MIMEKIILTKQNGKWKKLELVSWNIENQLRNKSMESIKENTFGKISKIVW